MVNLVIWNKETCLKETIEKDVLFFMKNINIKLEIH